MNSQFLCEGSQNKNSGPNSGKNRLIIFLLISTNHHFPSTGFRESSFLYALTAAGVAHSVARACAQGRLISCGCDPLGYRASHDPRGRAKVNKWEWSGCSHNLAYGIEFSKKFLDVREQVDDLQSKINVHNNNAGRSVSF